MRRFPVIACVLMASAVPSWAQQAAAPTAQPVPAVDLSGLWHAKKRFGPDAVGRLIITRTGEAYRADMGGRSLPVRAEGGTLSFELPGGRGRFRGRGDGADIRGLWARGRTSINDGGSISPIVLRRESAGRWSGEVEPLQDAYTFFLSLQDRGDNSLDALLRNPERDFGTQLNVRRLVRDGNAVRLMGQRGDAPEQLVAEGRHDPERNLLTLAFPNRGGTYEFVRDDDTSAFWPRGRTPGRYSYEPPLPRGDGWPVGTLAEAGIDQPAMERLVQSFLDRSMESPDAPQIHALLVARRGRLVLEEYFHGMTRDQLHTTRSAGKSMASVTVGAVMRSGAPLSLSSPVYQVMNGGSFPAGLEAQKRAMTLEHLLTMSSGYFCDDTNDQAPGAEDVMSEQTEEPDWYRYTLRVPMATPPGENSVYCSASPNLALGMVQGATAQHPIEAFDRLVAAPMDIDRYEWGVDPAGNAYGGGGLQLTPRDFLKFGQLMLNGGAWEGRRILDREFAAASVAPQYNLRNVYYGYQWWVEDVPYKNRMVRTYSARGNGGQGVIVVPELDLVVATMAANFFSRTQITYTGALVPRSILPAVRERGDDPNAPVVDREFTSRYGRSTVGGRVTRRP